MNLILLDSDDFITERRVILADRRFRHVLDVLKPVLGQALLTGRLGGCTGLARVVRIATDQIELEVNLDRPPPPPQSLTLLLALPRPKVLKRILQGVTAMGIKHIILLNSWRVDKSYWQSPLLEPQQLQQQLMLGLEQGRDTVLPELHLCPRFKPFVEDQLPLLLRNRSGYLAHPGSMAPCPTAVSGPGLLAVGPEGGFIPYEIERLVEIGLQPVHLGERALRVETATFALLGRLLPLSQPHIGQI